MVGMVGLQLTFIAPRLRFRILLSGGSFRGLARLGSRRRAGQLCWTFVSGLSCCHSIRERIIGPRADQASTSYNIMQIDWVVALHVLVMFVLVVKLCHENL